MPFSIDFHIHFNGQCKDAFEFYADIFDSTIESMLTYSEAPPDTEMPDDWGQKIMHANIHIGSVNLAGADVFPERYVKPAGFQLLAQVSSKLEAKRVFKRLSENGNIIMPLQKTFWSPSYGLVVDQYDIPWEVNYS